MYVLPWKCQLAKKVLPGVDKNTTNQFEIRNSSKFTDTILIRGDLRYQGEDYLQETPERSKL